MTFAPIAIVGQACLLPGASSCAELSRATLQGQDLVASAPAGRWRVDPSLVICPPDRPRRDAAWSDRGGYVQGFERLFDPRGFLLTEGELAGLDPVFLWTLHTAREALRDAGFDGPLPAALRPRGALVMGNLSFPTDGLSRFAEATWLRRAGLPAPPTPDPRNRFSSGLPAHLAAAALGLDARAFALDAACASSLYAIKLACDLLHDGAADVAVAGAVNKTDDLFIHVGFCALQAMSRTGQSRPFHRDADGLVPAEGAGFVVLRRLEDALAAGQRVLGVIRAVGLSNDGRGAGGMLAPSVEGQIRALRSAYAQSGLQPADIGLVECHATGTPVGDATELKSMGQVYAGLRDVPIGSLKSNLGHLITVAGVAGLQKMLGAMAAGVRPPTLHADQPLAELASSPFRLVTRPEPWNGPLRAAVSAFGFGGNNAHLIVESLTPGPSPGLGRGERLQREGSPSSGLGGLPEAPPAPAPLPLSRGRERGPGGEALAVVACAVMAADASTTEAFEKALFSGQIRLRVREDGAVSGHMEQVTLPLQGLKFPPRDLALALPQQLAILRVAREALSAAGTLPLENTSALVGMGCDPEIARYGGRWRAAEWARAWGADEAWIAQAQDAFAAPLEAAGVLGTMPNIPANRLNSQFGLGGPSFTIASEELSGLEALRLAARALRSGEIDAALVGAADFSAEIVHEQASRALDPAAPPSGDASVALVLRRLDDARRDGNPILAVLSGESLQAAPTPDLHPRLGKAHAATGLLHVAAAVTALAHGAQPTADGPRPALPSPTPRAFSVEARTLLGRTERVVASEDPQTPSRPLLLTPPPVIHVIAASDRGEVLRRLEAGQWGGEGGCRLALVATSEAELAERVRAAREALRGSARLPLSPAHGVFFRERPVGGELAFVFGGPASVYGHMGRELVLALPELTQRLSARFRRVEEVVGWLYDGSDVAGRGPVEKLWAASFLMQLHGELTQRTLGLKPDAVIGISSGETNALFAAGAWRDLDAMFHDIDQSGLYSRELAGEFKAARVAWSLPDGEPVRWVNFRVLAPVAQVQQALLGEPRARLTLIHAPHDVVIGGDAEACRRVLARVGPERARALGYDLVVHCEELAPFQDGWWRLHHRPTEPVPGVRFYSHAVGGSYEPTSESVADALLGQALRTVDFPALVRRAHADGVRVFLEHGPHGSCCRWIESTLGDHEDYAVIPLDLHGENPVLQAAHATASLFVVGVAVDHQALTQRLALAHRSGHGGEPTPPVLNFPAHRRPPTIPPLPHNHAMSTQTMAPAPALPSVLDDSPAPALPAPPAATHTVRPVAADARPHATPPVARPTAPAAPTLPPAPRAPVASPVAVSPAAAAPRPAPPPATALAPRAAAPALTRAPTGVAPGILAIQQHVTAIHRNFIDQQTSLHHRFLALRGFVPGAVPAAHHGASTPVTTPAPTTVAPTAPAAPVAPVATAPTAPAESARSLHTAPVPRSLPTPPPAPPPARPEPARAPAPAAALAKPAAAQPAPAAPAPAAKPVYPPAPVPVGPQFSRQDLEELAGGSIAKVFGPLFEQQEGYARQVRMPMPPLLLADRVTGILGEPGSMKTGTIWTETDVTWDAWYLHEGHIPGGIMIESGQADLLLISWLGADFLNRGERMYRLLGCDLRYHGRLPRPGDTLRYDIHVDGHAKHEDVRLFFFHYDCRVGDDVRLSVRHGQAGFFTEAELAASGGILWAPETGERTENPRLDRPRTPIASSYDRAAIDALSEGRPWECFGPSHQRAQTHVRTPRVGRGVLQLFDAITYLDHQGGPWGRGYLRAVQKITPQDWFFLGHFKGDPCMPGTLMFEGCLQAMAFYLLSMGFALDADGWTFEPVPDETYKLRCRGQVIPSSQELVYELFIDEVIDGPVPTLYADLLCTVDGLKAFHCRRMGVRLAPDWPMDRIKELSDLKPNPQGVASHDGFPFDYRSLMACAWGRPSEAFGPMYRVFDGHRRTPRLPGAPYHFVSRIAKIDGRVGVVESGAEVTAEYDVPPDAWYFDENGASTMPYCVLLEATLQPCGWLASATGITLTSPTDLCFRNLDGTATWHREVRRDAGTISTRTKLRSLSRSAGMVIVGFDVVCHQGDALVYEMKTVFGFFPPEALAAQVGISTGDDERRWLTMASDYRVDLHEHPARFFGGGARLAGDKLLMIDRLTGYWPDGGAAGLGRIRAEKDISPSEWFFKAHFYQDPVQPGSLGIEAMIQALQAYMLQRGLDRGMRKPRFEPLGLGKALTWKYRGQVVPENKLVTTEIEISSITREGNAVMAVAQSWLWVDGMCIYYARDLAMRIVDDAPEGDPSGGAPPSGPAPTGAAPATPAASSGHDAAQASGAADGEATLNLAHDPWIGDHRPTYTVPALPAMYMVDRLATAARRASGSDVVALHNVQIRRWAPVSGELRTRDVAEPLGEGRFRVRFEVYREASDPRLSRFEVAAEGEAQTGVFPAAPGPWPALADAVPQADPYDAASLFHGPALQLLRSWSLGPSGATAQLDLDASRAPLGALNVGLLDAATHAIPHDALGRWYAEVGHEQVAYPARIHELRVYGPTPAAGAARVEVRPEGYDGDPRFPKFRVQIVYGGSVWAELTLVEALFPKGPLGTAEPRARRAFLQHGVASEGVSLTTHAAGETRLDPAAVAASNWLPGTVEAAYRAAGGEGLIEAVAAKEHAARHFAGHPREIEVDLSAGSAAHRRRPFERLPFELQREGDGLVVRSTGEATLDTRGARDFWVRRLGSDTPTVADLYLGLAERFVRNIEIEDPDDFATLRGRSVIFLANHQVMVESPLFSMLVSSLIDGVVVTIAKIEHKTSWLGRMIAHSFTYPGALDPVNIVYFDRADKSSLLVLAEQMRSAMIEHGKSLLVHVEGTRALSSEARVEKISSIWSDVAMATGAPIVPVRFGHGLPHHTEERLDFPVGYGKQTFYLGRAIHAAELAALPLAERKRRVIDAINAAGPAVDEPTAPDPEFIAAVEQWRRRTGVTEPQAVLTLALERRPTASQPTRELVKAIHAGRLDLPATPEGVWLRGLARQLA